MASSCYFKDATCHHCGKKGHISKVCRSASSKRPVQTPKTKSAKWVETDQTSERESDADSEPALAIDKVEGRLSHPITVKLEVQGKPVVMEVDTGAAVSIISEETYDTLFSQVPISSKHQLVFAESIAICGEISVDVHHGDQKKTLSLVVINCKGYNLFGRDWLAHFHLDWKAIGLDTLEKSCTTLEMLLELECVTKLN